MNLVNTTNFELVKAKYIEAIDNTTGIFEHARWVYGQHPNDASLSAYIANGEMYALMDGGQVAALVAITTGQPSEYRSVRWQSPLEDHEIAVLHLLTVCPDHQGRGVGKCLLAAAVDLARASGKRSLRLDTLASNTPAQHMYSGFGFNFCGSQYLYNESTGFTDFFYYEYPLD